jgi:prepilin-type N-terminal cleavage/methylation domain-containing protein
VFVLNWKDKRGYSLVELIISMAVLAVVALSVMMMMKTGSNSYSNAKADLDLQMESQTLLAQINTMILEANKVVYDDTDPANPVLALYQIETEKVAVPVPSDGTVSKKEYTVNKTLKDVKLIKMNSSEGKLYLQESSTDITLPASGGALSYSDEELFSDYMDSFSASVDGSAVTVTIGMKEAKQKYTASSTTKIRNSLVTYP